MATTSLALKLSQAHVLNGALVLNVLGTGGVVLASRAVGGNNYIVAPRENNNVVVYFGTAFSFVVPNNVGAVTGVQVLSYDFNGLGTIQSIFNENVNIPVENDDVIYVNEVSFTLLD